MKLIKCLVVIGAVIYTLSPVDLIPDVIPIIGWLDDLGIDVGAALFCLFAGRDASPKQAQAVRRVIVRRIR